MSKDFPVELLHFKDKVKILKVPRKKDQIFHKGKKLRQTSDFARSICKSRYQWSSIFFSKTQ